MPNPRPAADAFQRIQGQERRAVAEDIWAGWREQGFRCAILVGFAGVGKSTLVDMLLAEAERQGLEGVSIEVPEAPLDLDGELRGSLVEALRDCGLTEKQRMVERETSFPGAMRSLIRAGVLVAVDEFQRLLDPRTGELLFGAMQRITKNLSGAGLLLAVSNREPNPGWSEAFHTYMLASPRDEAAAIELLQEHLRPRRLDAVVPATRYGEVVRRLGANPRALRLLGTLLRSTALDDLLPPEDDTGAVATPLVNDLERQLLSKAITGLSAPHRDLLRAACALREPAPLALLTALAEPPIQEADPTRPLRDRYLLELLANRYRVHPVVREIERSRAADDPATLRAAHRRALAWYAHPLLEGGGPRGSSDADLALRLSAVRYHADAAGDRDTLRRVIGRLRPYLERRFRQTTPKPETEAERDARIELLTVTLEQPGSPGMAYHLALLLRDRGGGGDAERALPHAARACDGQDYSIPWVLHIQLTRQATGLNAAVEVGRRAVRAVSPAKDVYSVYQVLGTCLVDLGNAQDAVRTLLTGAQAEQSQYRARLVEEAAWCAAAAPGPELLTQIEAFVREDGGLEPQLALVQVLQAQRQARWAVAAGIAQRARTSWPTYLHLALQEALSWLGCGRPEEAQGALSRLRQGLRLGEREGATWLAALVALQRGRLADANRLLGVYLGTPAPTDTGGIRAHLLHAWDTRVATISEANPALNFPILPAAVTGLEHDVIRPQHGPPQLPATLTSIASQTAPVAGARALRVLIVATEWASHHGGLSTFNRHLCGALAAAGAEVWCVVPSCTSEEKTEALKESVHLVACDAVPGLTEEARLSHPPSALPAPPQVVIGHDRITGPAALTLTLTRAYGEAKLALFIHTAPEEIEFWKERVPAEHRATRAEARRQEQLELCLRAGLVVPVGPRLHEEAELLMHGLLGGRPPIHEFEPAIYPGPKAEQPPTVVQVLIIGRMEDAALKGLPVAAPALSRALAQPGLPAARVRLVVRGVEPGKGAAVRESLEKQLTAGRFLIIPREFNAAPEAIEQDLRSSSLLLMPSQVEGYGLVGLEAIQLGVPVLLSAESGLAQDLRGLFGDESRHHIVEMTGDDAHDIEQWQTRIAEKLRDRDRAFALAEELRQGLIAQRSWPQSGQRLIAALEATIAASNNIDPGAR